MKKLIPPALATAAMATVAYGAVATNVKTTTAPVMSSAAVILLPASVSAPLVAPTANPTPIPIAKPGLSLATVETIRPLALAPLDLSDMRLWNWSGKWHASEWGNGSSFTPWKFARISRQNNGDVKFVVDAQGAPELKAQNGIAAASSGLWEADVTLPKLSAGLVVAPLWLYNDRTRDEIDFEFAGRNGLDISIHSYIGSLHMQKKIRLYKGVDFSGKRVRFGIAVDQVAGIAAFYLDSQKVLTVKESEIGFFPKTPMKPIISMWPARSDWSNFVSWTGRWTPLTKTGNVAMTVHGYGYRAFN